MVVKQKSAISEIRRLREETATTLVTSLAGSRLKLIELGIALTL
jgi:hypothetical protein